MGHPLLVRGWWNIFQYSGELKIPQVRVTFSPMIHFPDDSLSR
jgi:hypothetical protein